MVRGQTLTGPGCLRLCVVRPRGTQPTLTAPIAATSGRACRFSLARRTAKVDGGGPCRGKPNKCSHAVSTFAGTLQGAAAGPIANRLNPRVAPTVPNGQQELTGVKPMYFERLTGGRHRPSPVEPPMVRLSVPWRAAFAKRSASGNMRWTSVAAMPSLSPSICKPMCKFRQC